MRWSALTLLPLLALLLSGCPAAKPTTCDVCVSKGLFCNPVTFECQSPITPPDQSVAVPQDMTQPTNDDMAQ